MLITKVTELDALCIETERGLMDCSRERDRAQRWVRAYQGSIEDYEASVRESGLSEILHEDVIRDVIPGSLLLTRHIKNMVHELQSMNRKTNKLDNEIQRMRKEHAGALQQYILDLERKCAELRSAKDHLQEVAGQLECTRKERDQAVDQAQRALKESAAAEESLRKIQREKDEEIAELASKSASQMRTIREQFETERYGLQMQIDSLTKSKIELQVEIGHLSRERRAATFELESVHKNIALTRDQFRRDLGIV
eukprot:jgi/Hompol1/1353/HPOL_001714-RA